MATLRAEIERYNNGSSNHGEYYKIFEYSSTITARAKQKKTLQFTRSSNV